MPESIQGNEIEIFEDDDRNRMITLVIEIDRQDAIFQFLKDMSKLFDGHEDRLKSK